MSGAKATCRASPLPTATWSSKLVTRKAEPGDRRHGTSVRVWPNAKYFDAVDFPKHELVHLLRSKAVLMPGVTVSLTSEKTKDKQQWLYKGGLRDYLSQTLAADPVIELFEGERYADAGESRELRRR